MLAWPDPRLTADAVYCTADLSVQPMIKKVLIILALGILQHSIALACSCVRPGPTINEAFKNADVVFVGQCVSGELKKKKDSERGEYYFTQFIFKIQSSLKGLSNKEKVVVETGIGFGDCGFPFKLGLSYLIYGYYENDSFETHICTRTRLAGFYPKQIEERARKEIDELNELIKSKKNRLNKALNTDQKR